MEKSKIDSVFNKVKQLPRGDVKNMKNDEYAYRLRVGKQRKDTHKYTYKVSRRSVGIRKEIESLI